MSIDDATRAFLRGDLAEAERHLAANDDTFARLCILAATKSATRAKRLLSASLRAGERAFVEAVAGHTPMLLPTLLDDTSSGHFGVEAVLALHEKALVPDALHVIAQSSLTRHPMLRPTESVLGELHLLAGRTVDAIALLEAGLASARSIEAVPHVANAAGLLARALDLRGDAGDRDRAVLLAAEAHELSHRCSIV